MAAPLAPQQDTPATRFRDRQRRWRGLVQKFYARHADLEPHAVLLMGWLFDQAERTAGSVMREYDLRTDGGLFVRMNADPQATKRWSWWCATLDVEGRGFYELWGLRFDVPIALAAEQIWMVVRAGRAR